MASVSARDPDARTVDDHWRQWEQEMRDRTASVRRRRRRMSWMAASVVSSFMLIWLFS
jgi:hypothetical protein